MKVERCPGTTTRASFRVDLPSGLRHLTYRDVLALVGVRAGMAQMRWRRHYSPYFYDGYLQPESDVYGVSFGTLYGLQSKKLVTHPNDEVKLELTALGHDVLEAIEGLPGVVLPELREAVST